MPRAMNCVGLEAEHPVYGEFTVVDQAVINNRSKAKIRFKNTGYEYWVNVSDVHKLAVKDQKFPLIFGVGYFDDANKFGYNSNINEHNRIYAIWRSMLSRCYDPNAKDYQWYGALGIRVHPVWHSFKNFFLDFIKMPNYNNWACTNNGYDLDKDTLQQGIPENQKVYSPWTCVLIPRNQNMAQMARQTYGGTSTNPYVGVSFRDNSWHASFNHNGSEAMHAKFSDPYSAAVYRDCVAHYKYNIPTLNGGNRVPITMDAFSKARLNRIDHGSPYPYKQMMDVIE